MEKEKNLKIRTITQSEMKNFLEKNEYQRNIPPSLICYGCFEEERDKELLGVVGLYKIAWHTTEIRNLCVKRERRNQGIGKFMVSQMLERISSPVAIAVVEVNNVPSLKIFHGLGFKQVDVFYNEDTGNQLYFMLKTLKKERIEF
jgi:ribosomal protein S18 acetylase RimI-like enzyme